MSVAWGRTSSNRFFGVLVLLIAFVAGTAACDKGKPQKRALAELVEVVEGEATRRQAKTEWTPASAGNTFVDGEALRTNTVGIARLRFAGELLRMGPETTVFFGQKKLDFDGEIEVGEGLIELGIDFGEAEVTTTGRVRLIKRDNNMKFEVLVGKATITERGEVSVVEPGQELAFEIGVGVLVDPKSDDRPIDAGVADAAVLADAASLGFWQTSSARGFEVVRIPKRRGSSWALVNTIWGPKPNSKSKVAPQR